MSLWSAGNSKVRQVSHHTVASKRAGSVKLETMSRCPLLPALTCDQS